MATKTFKVSLSLDNPRIIQSSINVRSFDKQSIKISIELTKNSQVYQIPTGAQIKISLLKLARQEQKIILDVPFTSADSIDWIVPDYLDGYQGEVRVGVYLIVGAENIDVGYFNITSSVSDIDSAAEEFTESVLQGWDQIEADLAEIRATITQVNTLASDFTADVTSKYNAFDTSVTQAGQTIDDILALQPQFQSVLDETTGKDVISAPEIILARGGSTTLGERLDADKSEVTAQLAQIALNPVNFGAVVDRATSDNSAIQATIDYASVNGGTVMIPNGSLYTRGSLNLKGVKVIDDSGVRRQESGTPEWDCSGETELEIVGHRGLLNLYPENSAVAFQNSIMNKQAHSIEFDMRTTSDEKLIVFHDTILDRVTNLSGNVKDTTEAEIMTADLGGYFSPVYAGERVLRLYEACSIIRGLNVKYIYAQTNVGEISDIETRKRILTATINTFKTYDIMNKVVLCCIGTGVANLIREIDSTIKIGVMAPESVGSFNSALAWGKLDRNCLIGMNYTFFLNNPTLPTNAKKEGVDVFVWTLNNIHDVDRVRKLGITKIMTDVNLMGVR